ncbi:hypothetical protein ABT390_19860 [Streptomyces aurantiacus]|uniref:Uncharacterized protein n=1 Tax=Streptomyces aurantiacus JA 4570 TaxID=1286094 RepID=S3ZHI2_9ACTN|nr:hypothetical protein [Streptomyces aurantiacus]EPH42134.1 hypothetical protein STRAU_4812 [Streptomyces aurantiacus JA 4570]
MGIESDQLVFDYLSRVGDVAQQRQLSSGTRMKLVSGLRSEIDRRRAGAADSPAAVRRILDRLGTPDDLVDAAAANPDDVSAAIPEQDDEPTTSSRLRRVVPEAGRLRRAVPRPRLRPASAQRSAPEKDSAARASGPAAAPMSGPVPEPRRPAPPHLASTEELGTTGDAGLEPDWWRVDNTPTAGADTVHGFVGGVEIPEMLKPPPTARAAGPGRPVSMAKPGGGSTREGTEDAEDYGDDAEEGFEGAEDGEWDDEEGPDGAFEAAPRRRLGGLLPPSARAAAPAKGAAAQGSSAKADVAGGAVTAARAFSLTSPLVLLAALALIAGAVIGNWFALVGGWVVAWFSRKLTPAEKKVGVFVVPGLAVASGIGWLWGRSQGKWGDTIVKGHMNEAVADTWPWVVRGAAVASALFLVWRSQRQRPAAEE